MKEPLGTEINDMDCYRLGAMLHLDIQKGKKVVKTAEFQQDIGGTSACTKILIMATKGYGQLTSNDT